MMTIEHARLRRPVVTALGGSAIAVDALINSGWTNALAVEAVTVVATIGYYFLGGRDTDFGAMIGSQTDERQASIGVRARALSGCAMGAVAVAGFVIATAAGATTWPFELLCGVGVIAFLAGSVIYRTGE